ncbi:hypothetical protein PR003_g28869 [Phytophthora rubi]|uniref:RxLR effector protein n=1 Tax=Phytophthora rubi TaxID=129364 RepID=A0A6A4BM57_9STRA|nr:hypothetical protein PR001_g27329 [Phytophthora rubi]KAE9277137.1 hypothetical protein PR003_g28869 [Phytophthora rubi]
MHSGKSTSSKIAPSERLLSSENSAGISKRLLRSHASPDEESAEGDFVAAGEERGVDGAWVSRIAQLDRDTWAIKKLDLKVAAKAWLATGSTPKSMFDYVNHRSSWANIENNKRAIMWFRFTKGYGEKNGAGSFTDYEIYHLLRTEVPDDKLALALEGLKQIPDLKNLAETVQKYQFKFWVREKETPTSIAKLLGIPHSPTLVTERGPKDAILSQYTSVLFGKEKKMTRSTTIR